MNYFILLVELKFHNIKFDLIAIRYNKETVCDKTSTLHFFRERIIESLKTVHVYLYF